jgi:ABC-2 type transport system permease protein
MLGGNLISGYQTAFPSLAPFANVTWWGWQYNNLPLAGQFDWPSLIPVAIAAAVLLAIGVQLFALRDLGSTTHVPFPRLPAAPLGVGGPARQSFGERLPVALGWGIGIGILGLILGSAAKSLADVLATASLDTQRFFHTVFPDYDLTNAGSALQLIFVGFGFILAGFAAATAVAGWASDEGGNRLEFVLSAPVSRARWAVLSALGVYGASAVMTLIAGIGIGLGATSTGGDVVTPMVGTAVVGLYAAALAGIGLAFGGLFRASWAAEVIAVIVIATFLLDIVIPALGLPSWVHDLALTSHLGKPMLGQWDWAGMIACAVLAIGGATLGAWGLARRDVAR